MIFNFKNVLKWVIRIFFLFLFVLFILIFVGKPSPVEEPEWGINFSSKHSELMGLDWKENYLALLDDLKVRRIKLITHWDYLEPEKGNYDFEDIDWQMKEAKIRGVEILFVIGMKTPRWPECHVPEWAANLSFKEQQESVLKLISLSILRYKVYDNIWGWQIENEPFFHFGDCPPTDAEFLRKEIELVKELDEKKRPVVITESGEGPLWIKAAKVGDIVGTTLYKKVWFKEVKIYVYYPFPEVFYWRKKNMIKNLFGKEVICVEMQAEPWGPRLVYDVSLKEQEKTMNLEQLKRIIEFTRKIGFDEVYLWGAEWWFWMKKTQNRPEIWDYLRVFFEQNSV